MKLSIIICVYNTPKEYLSECLESITDSTLKSLKGDYEICMIDDGSTVDYSDLIEKYGLRVKKTENRGIFSARKSGAELADGEYAIYCDSDDTVSFNYYLPMVEKAIQSDADIVINDWATHTQRARYYARRDETVSGDIDARDDEILPLLAGCEGRQHSFYVLWNKLYKRSALLSAFDSLTSLGFDERSSYSEDAALNFFIWKNAKRVVNVHTGYYFYRIHQAQSVIFTTEEKLKRQIDSMALTLDIMRENIGDHPKREEIISSLKAWSALMARAHYSQARGAGFSALYEYIKEKYRVEKLTLATLRDGYYYESKALLGDNFKDIDKALMQIWDAEPPVRVKYSKADRYLKAQVEYLNSLGKITDDRAKMIVEIPKPIIGFKKKLLHNTFLYRIGLILFKKGSCARNFLKKFL